MWLLLVIFLGGAFSGPRIEAAGLHDTRAMCDGSASQVRAVLAVAEVDKIVTLCIHTREGRD